MAWQPTCGAWGTTQSCLGSWAAAKRLMASSVLPSLLLITTLFRGQEGLEFFNRTVERRVARLPGFAGFKGLSERLAPIVQA